MSGDRRLPPSFVTFGMRVAAPTVRPPPGRGKERGAGGRLRGLGRRPGLAALVFALVSGLITHADHLFKYPLYLTDEGIYMERVWSLIRETKLTPYTYDYDHAPGGWITIAGWVLPLPRQFETFGTSINTGRALMLVVHVACVFLLFEVTRRLSGSVLAASIAAFLFNFSPLAVYFQRQVLLDNLMVFWVLLSMFILLHRESHIWKALGAGLAFGMALITKENAIFFAPAFLYLLHRGIRGSTTRRFVRTLWPFAMAAPLGAYIMFSVLKSELLPSRLSFSLSHPPTGHVSLLYTLWWQLNRNQGTLLTRGSYLYSSWLPKDSYLLLCGVAAMGTCLYLGMRDRERNHGFLVAGLLAFGYAFYLLRGSVVLDFYVIPMVPLFAMNIGMVADRILRGSHRFVRVGLPVLVGLALLLAPATGYLFTYNDQGRRQVADQYHLNLTVMQREQVAWIRHHIPPGARLITDEDIWTELHDVRPYYPYAHSHWNASSDPTIRDKLFARNWQNIDYVVMSNKMRQAIVGNNGDGRESWILNAIDNHSTVVWQTGQGDIRLQIYQIQK
ncbi:MAG TPA: glycosyltransferase family 39 protein [Streptosporangiaceae bacterium]